MFQVKAKALCLVTEPDRRECHPVFCTPQAPGAIAGPLRHYLMQPQNRKEAIVAYSQAEGRLSHEILFCLPLGPLLLAEVWAQ